jgi:hypothetical protein
VAENGTKREESLDAHELAFARRETKSLQFTAMSGTKTARNVIIMTSIAKVASL